MRLDRPPSAVTGGTRADVRIVAVSRLANYIAGLFARERNFARIGVRGEISNLREQANGNVYFDLKDRDALLNCVAFSEAAATFPALANGDEVVAYGSVQTYAKASRYQLRVLDVAAEGGTGALHRRYEDLKTRLTAEGLFAAERKRALPRYPFRVALVTSENADGAKDFLTQALARAPHVEVIVVPTPVQGERAAPEIVRAIARASAMDVDLLVVARGGGSFEDLFAFSDERVVRALAASRVPTVSAIGHEADAPLTDFVADHRAPTPSAAAQTVLPRRDDLLALVAERRRTLARDTDRAVTVRRQHVDVGRATARVRGARARAPLRRPPRHARAPARRGGAGGAARAAARALRAASRPARARRARAAAPPVRPRRSRRGALGARRSGVARRARAALVARDGEPARRRDGALARTARRALRDDAGVVERTRSGSDSATRLCDRNGGGRAAADGCGAGSAGVDDPGAAGSRKPHGARRTRRDAWRTTDQPLLRARSSGWRRS